MLPDSPTAVAIFFWIVCTRESTAEVSRILALPSSYPDPNNLPSSFEMIPLCQGFKFEGPDKNGMWHCTITGEPNASKINWRRTQESFYKAFCIRQSSQNAVAQWRASAWNYN